MANKKKHQAEEQEEYFDDFPFEEDMENDMMANLMNDLLDASNKQMMMAIELTKLIVSGSTHENMEEHVFSVFKRANSVVSENFALKKILEQLEQ